MPFTEDICVVVSCDGCGDGWTTDQHDFIPHFRDYDTARAHLIAKGWTIQPAPTTGADAGVPRLVCPDCTRLEACAAAGHVWGPWEQVGPVPDRRGGWTGRVRSCRACPDSQWDPPLHTLTAPAPAVATSSGGGGRS